LRGCGSRGATLFERADVDELVADGGGTMGSDVIAEWSVFSRSGDGIDERAIGGGAGILP